MGNGFEADIRELRQTVSRIEREGCGHRDGHDETLRGLWKAIREEEDARVDAINEEKKLREGSFVKMVLLVLTIVLGALVGSMLTTSAVVEKAVSRALAAQPAVGMRR